MLGDPYDTTARPLMDQLQRDQTWQKMIEDQQRQAQHKAYEDIMRKVEAMQAQAQHRPRILEGTNAWIDEKGLWIEANDGTRVFLVNGVTKRLVALVAMLELAKVVPVEEVP